MEEKMYVIRLATFYCLTLEYVLACIKPQNRVASKGSGLCIRIRSQPSIAGLLPGHQLTCSAMFDSWLPISTSASPTAIDSTSDVAYPFPLQLVDSVSFVGHSL
ncbi:hypothetical protein EVAR_53633_1 [Eumeta japonica]|uniref:Uncharacterized protein n=1 Tax=Eumeta variegata TaxID=151549 RepID=A0A4C1X2H3_EUMVA|nr:hypothetical protein EVAR_53633_1 [Eumeta japonica]